MSKNINNKDEDFIDSTDNSNNNDNNDEELKDMIQEEEKENGIISSPLSESNNSGEDLDNDEFETMGFILNQSITNDSSINENDEEYEEFDDEEEEEEEEEEDSEEFNNNINKKLKTSNEENEEELGKSFFENEQDEEEKLRIEIPDREKNDIHEILSNHYYRKSICIHLAITHRISSSRSKSLIRSNITI